MPRRTTRKTIYIVRRTEPERGGRIVFSTIAENIKSFFTKEETLAKQPRGVPEAASEIYDTPQPTKRIVEKPLPKETETPTLPFSPDELRTALEKKERKRPEPEETPDISHEISAFESALHTVHDEPDETPVRQAPATPRTDGFFDEYEQFLLREDITSEGLMDADLVHRMREFHDHQREGKEYYVYSQDVKTAIQRKLNELKILEHEWFHTRTQMDELERGLQSIEDEIHAKSAEMKALLQQAKSKSRLEQAVPSGKEFVLPDGRKLKSLLDLKIALRTMPDTVFAHHVHDGKNDFSAWVRSVMGDEEFADRIERVTDKENLQRLVSTA